MRFFQHLTLALLLFAPAPTALASKSSWPVFVDQATLNLHCHTPACLQLQQLEQTRFAQTPLADSLGCEQLHAPLDQPWLGNPFSACHQHKTPLALQLSPRYAGLAKETRNIGILSVGIMLAIFAMPEEISNWDRSKMKPNMLGDKWIENNQKGPVWDKDEWEINYIGHPYFGAVYYVVARNQGFGPLGSFGYSFLMSAFLWEFGIEALAETPSKQDLVVTPVIGSILGEAFYIWEQRILANDGKLWGSSTLGGTGLFLVNPAGTLSKAINRRLDNQRFIQEANTYWVAYSTPLYEHSDLAPAPNWFGLTLELKF